MAKTKTSGEEGAEASEMNANIKQVVHLAETSKSKQLYDFDDQVMQQSFLSEMERGGMPPTPQEMAVLVQNFLMKAKLGTDIK